MVQGNADRTIQKIRDSSTTAGKKRDDSEISKFLSESYFKICNARASALSLYDRTYDRRQGGTACMLSKSATLYSHGWFRQVPVDNWAPCRLQPQRCCLLELITITQKFPLKTSTVTWLYAFWEHATEVSGSVDIKGPVTPRCCWRTVWTGKWLCSACHIHKVERTCSAACRHTRGRVHFVLLWNMCCISTVH